MNHRKTALIFGAGPAGLTAAYELLATTDIKPIIFELSNEIGGLSRTVIHNGNRMDIGGHRFFSKSDRITSWWTNILPIQGSPSSDYRALGVEMPLAAEACQKRLGETIATHFKAPDPEEVDNVLLLRRRLSRIYFQRNFFDYPLSLNIHTVAKLGVIKCVRIALYYLKSVIWPIRNEKTLEDFFINRFGKELYRTFFKDYTEKVWGVPCSHITAEWGAQRIKGLSVGSALVHSLRKILKPRQMKDVRSIETSLLEQFMYPKLGPGQLWEEVARQVTTSGGELHLNTKIVGLCLDNKKITSVTVRNLLNNQEHQIHGDYFFSSIPVSDLIAALAPSVPLEVRLVSERLQYRDFMTVGLLVDSLSIKNQTKIKSLNNLVPDNWIYVQEKDVKIGRIQIFNNWSPYLVQDPNKVWLGLEYFCQEGDDLWTASDIDMIQFAVNELAEIGIINKSSIRDGVVIRVPKAYPAYFGSYSDFSLVRNFTDAISNLFLIGRNGMHRYNNMDHSMLTAMAAVENVIAETTDKRNIWHVNTEESHHEQAGER